MEELGKALAEAVRAGKDLAPMAIWGYYIVRVMEALLIPLAFFGVALVAGHTIRFGIRRTQETAELKLSAGALDERNRLQSMYAELSKLHYDLLRRVRPEDALQHTSDFTT